MVQLATSDIQTREVLDWKGVHLFHFKSSSCSQKTRIVLNLKQAEWTSHEIDLSRQENFEPWYLGINPRGLVPALVIDGEVHIESNDIITLLDARLPGVKLIPEGQETRTSDMPIPLVPAQSCAIDGRPGGRP
jgi:glutathione S-transferase